MRALRTVVVVATLAGVAATLGALAAGGALATSNLMRGTLGPYQMRDVFSATRLGGLLGGLLGPTCALIFLRRVPLWLALGLPACATYLGGALGEFFASAGFITAPSSFLITLIVLHGRGDGTPERNALPMPSCR